MKFPLLFILIFCSQYLTVAQIFSLQQQFSNSTPIQFAGGISVADYDLDGDLDLYIVAIGAYDADKPETWNRLLRNDLGRFTDVTDEAGLLHTQYAMAKFLDEGIKLGTSWGDFNNDTYPDLFLTNHGYDQLWFNKGDGTFEDVTIKAGVSGGEDAYSASALWWDYDLDGDLDLYVSRWRGFNSLYKNDSNGIFSDVSTASGLEDVGTTWTSIPFDVNKDGLPDLYIVNDFSPNYLYLNNGKGSFDEVTHQYRLDDLGNGMGVDICDFKKDGNFDIYLTNIWQVNANPFFVNEGEVFREQANKANLGNAAWGWSCRFFDMDHDRDEDLYVVNQRFFENGALEYNRLFELDDERFEERSNHYGLDSYPDARGMEIFDYNKDGDLDIVVGNWGSSPALYDNGIVEKGNWIMIDLEGTTSNRDAFGSVVRVKTGDEYQHRLNHGANYLGQSIKPLHFGLGSAGKVDEVTVFWPNGLVEQLYDIPAKQHLKLVEGEQEAVFNITYGKDENSPNVVSDILVIPKELLKVTVYPNPITERSIISINSHKSLTTKVTLTDLLGRIVFSEVLQNRSSKIELDFSTTHVLRSGTYYLNVASGKKRKTIKLIKL